MRRRNLLNGVDGAAALSSQTMLGRFLELSIDTPDIRASLDFYSSLGFAQAAVGDAWRHPYAVVTDGRICLGLHARPASAPSLTFVKPDLLKQAEIFERLGVEFEFRHLGGDVFNELGWADPSGNLLHLVEARTFSPSAGAAAGRSALGYFVEIALPAHEVEAAKAYWERLGFVGMAEADARIARVVCTSDTIDVGLYPSTLIRTPTVLFECENFDATLARLAALGAEPSRALPAELRGLPAAMLTAPEGTPLLFAPHF